MARSKQNETVKIMQQVAEVEDWLMANPCGNKSQSVRKFSTKFHKSQRCVWSYFKLANENIKKRMRRHAEIKEQVYDEMAREAAHKDYLSRDEALELLATIARGNARQITIQDKAQVFIPSDSERIQVIRLLVDINGWRVKEDSAGAVDNVLNINVLDEETLNQVKKLYARLAEE